MDDAVDVSQPTRAAEVGSQADRSRGGARDRDGSGLADSDLPGLVDAARFGDQRAWDQLVERFLPLVTAVTARLRLSGADAADVNQTVWLRLVEHLDGIRDPAALPGWIATTTRNEGLRVIRARQRTVPFDPQEPAQLDLRSEPDDSLEEIFRYERRQALRTALGQLPPKRRELLLLLLADPPIPYQEISQRLGIPVGSIGPTRARALEQLRRTAALVPYLAAQPTGKGRG